MSKPVKIVLCGLGNVGKALLEFMDLHLDLGYALLKELFIRASDALSFSNDRYSALYARQLSQDDEC